MLVIIVDVMFGIDKENIYYKTFWVIPFNAIDMKKDYSELTWSLKDCQDDHRLELHYLVTRYPWLETDEQTASCIFLDITCSKDAFPSPLPSVPFSLVFHNHSGIAWLWTSSHSSSLLICLISFDPRSLQTLVYWIQIRLWNNVTWKGNGKGNNCSKHLWNRKLFLALLCLMLVSSEYVLFKISFFQVSRRYKQIAFDFDTFT